MFGAQPVATLYGDGDSRASAKATNSFACHSKLLSSSFCMAAVIRMLFCSATILYCFLSCILLPLIRPAFSNLFGPAETILRAAHTLVRCRLFH